MAIQLEHPDPAQQQASLALQMREFWKEGYLCDVAMKSRDGKEYKAHRVVLSAASTALKTLLGGEFSEGKKKEEPVEFCTSDASVAALLDFIYGGKPQVTLEDSIELLGLADAYNLPQLAKAIEAGLRASLENVPLSTALRILQESHGLHDLKDACEDHLAFDFEECTQHPDFVKLKPTQLGRLLQRGDLNVQCEDVVLQGVFRWLNHSKDRDQFLGLLVQHVDFPSISFENLGRIGRFAASNGQNDDELQREVKKALQAQKKRSTDEAANHIWPKRQCLQHLSPGLGVSVEGARKVLSGACGSLCWNGDALYAAREGSRNIPCSVICWKPGQSEEHIVAGQGARTGFDLGSTCNVFASFTDDFFVYVTSRLDSWFRHKLIRFQNGSGQLVPPARVRGADFSFCYISPNGVVYVATDDGHRLQKLVGTTLQHVTDLLPFRVGRAYVTGEEVVYFSDPDHGRILRISPGETEPVVVGEVTEASKIDRLFVTEECKIYAADVKQRKVWAFRPGDRTCFEVLQCPEGMTPTGIVAQDRMLYVSMRKFKRHTLDRGQGVYEYLLPPVLKLQ